MQISQIDLFKLLYNEFGPAEKIKEAEKKVRGIYETLESWKEVLEKEMIKDANKKELTWIVNFWGYGVRCERKDNGEIECRYTQNL